MGAHRRYIPAKVKKIIELEHGKGCSYPGCKKPAKVLHHTKRFVLDQRSDPDLLKPLCKTHHELCHNIAVVEEESNPVKWSLSLAPCSSEEKRRIDERVLVSRSFTS